MNNADSDPSASRPAPPRAASDGRPAEPETAPPGTAWPTRVLSTLGSTCEAVRLEWPAASELASAAGDARSQETDMPTWTPLWAGEAGSCVAPPEHSVAPPFAILSGSFNPVHAGHRRMAEVAEQHLGGAVEFELPVRNADKPACTEADLEQRVRGFRSTERLWLTALPTFQRKASVLKPRWFIVGVDTLVRIADLRFYGNDPGRLELAIEQWEQQDTRFLVFGRTRATGFAELHQLEIPPRLRARCEGVSERSFRMDISSTEIRRSGKW